MLPPLADRPDHHLAGVGPPGGRRGNPGWIFGEGEPVAGVHRRTRLEPVVVPVQQGPHRWTCHCSPGPQELGDVRPVGEPVDDCAVTEVRDRADLTECRYGRARRCSRGKSSVLRGRSPVSRDRRERPWSGGEKHYRCRDQHGATRRSRPPQPAIAHPHAQDGEHTQRSNGRSVIPMVRRGPQ